MNLFVLWDNSSRSASNQITPMCAQHFSIRGGNLIVIHTHFTLDFSPLVLGFSGKEVKEEEALDAVLNDALARKT